jgi:5'-methylthioadenosine phosphorylase
MKVGIIGGTGVYEAGDLEDRAEVEVQTRYGAVTVLQGRVAEGEVAFLARHGSGHSVPPHRVNYRANIAALKAIGCGAILASNAVGSIRADMRPGSFVLPDQFLDFTRGRAGTFYDGEDGVVRHVDVTEPYCPALRAVAAEVLAGMGLGGRNGAVYVCTEGPRFETPAEIRMFDRLGGDLVGMTGAPEVVLAAEAGLCYASVCVVTNLAAGLSGQPLTEGEVGALMREKLPQLRAVLLEVSRRVGALERCPCGATAPAETEPGETL